MIADVRNEIATAITTGTGWNAYRVVPDTKRYPLVIVDVTSVEYMKTYGGALTILVDVVVLVSLAEITKAQDLLDEAMSWGTDYSIPTALTTYTDYDVIKSAKILTADGFDAVTLGEDERALSATLHLEVTTNT